MRFIIGSLVLAGTVAVVGCHKDKPVSRTTLTSASADSPLALAPLTAAKLEQAGSALKDGTKFEEAKKTLSARLGPPSATPDTDHAIWRVVEGEKCSKLWIERYKYNDTALLNTMTVSNSLKGAFDGCVNAK